MYMHFCVYAYVNSLWFISVPHVWMAFRNGYFIWNPSYLPLLLFSFGRSVSLEWFWQEYLGGEQKMGQEVKRGGPSLLLLLPPPRAGILIFTPSPLCSKSPSPLPGAGVLQTCFFSVCARALCVSHTRSDDSEGFSFFPQAQVEKQEDGDGGQEWRCCRRSQVPRLFLLRQAQSLRKATRRAKWLLCAWGNMERIWGPSSIPWCTAYKGSTPWNKKRTRKEEGCWAIPVCIEDKGGWHATRRVNNGRGPCCP